MGWLDKLAGRPQEPRKGSGHKREERAAERAAMRASHSTISPTGSWTHQRSSRPMSRRTSGTQPSPGTSPRGHEHGVSDKWKQALGLVGSHHPSHHQTHPPPSQHQPSLATHSRQSETAYQQHQHQLQHQRRPSGSYIPHADSMPRSAAAAHAQPQQYAQHAEQVRELQQRLHQQEAQVQEVEALKQRLLTEQRGAQEWRDKWNLQNFKLHLMVDMLVLQAVEQQPQAAGQLPGVGPAATTAAAAAAAHPQGPMIMAGVGRGPMARKDDALVAEDMDDY